MLVDDDKYLAYITQSFANKPKIHGVSEHLKPDYSISFAT